MSEHWFESQPDWFKTAVFYELHTRAFFDSSDDGTGTSAGSDPEARLPRVARRSTASGCCRSTRRRCATAATTSPIPHGSHPEFGTVEEFAAFVEAAHERRMRVIADLVMNHTSNEHPWFQESRQGPDSPKADWYVWSDTVHRYEDARIIFVDTRAVELDVRRGARRVLLAPLLPPPAGPQLREPGGAGSDARRAPLLARPRASTASASMRCRTCSRRRGRSARTSRDARLPQAGARRGRRELPRPGAARRGEPVAGGRRRLLRRRRRVPHGVPFPGDAADVHGAPARGGDSRSSRSSTARLRSPTPASGGSSSATTTS